MVSRSCAFFFYKHDTPCSKTTSVQTKKFLKDSNGNKNTAEFRGYNFPRCLTVANETSFLRQLSSLWGNGPFAKKRAHDTKAAMLDDKRM